MNTVSMAHQPRRVLGLNFGGPKHKRASAKDTAPILSPVQLRQLVAAMVD
ncbi:hypothetical protein [Alteraurantiacibacter aquimixticola]|nr:hypothetical protein [Alteraurantiacibacter aquimixticola]